MIDIVFAMIVLGTLTLPLERWPLMAAAASASAACSGRFGFAFLFAVIGLDAIADLRRRTAMKRKNIERAAKMHARNFGERPSVEPWCVIATAAARYQAKHGRKAWPSGWVRCAGKVEAAHYTPRGMGGCNSSAEEVVYLCKAHHGEQEGRSEEFETKYGVDLLAAGAEQRKGLGDLMI